MVGAFEAFLRDLFRERIDGVARMARYKFDDLPLAAQKTHAYGTLEPAMKGSPGEPKKKQIHRVPGIQQAAKLVANGLLSGEAFANTRSNPNPGNVKAMFNDVGYEDLFSKAYIFVLLAIGELRFRSAL